MENKPITIDSDRGYVWYRADPVFLIIVLPIAAIAVVFFKYVSNDVSEAIFVLVLMGVYLVIRYLILPRIPSLHELMDILEPSYSLYSDNKEIIVKEGMPFAAKVFQRNQISDYRIEKSEKNFWNSHVVGKGDTLVLLGQSHNEIGKINLWAYNNDKVTQILAAIKPHQQNSPHPIL